MSLGENRPTATILSYMRNHKTVTSIELEHETGLRQPEVSIGMDILKERGWIKTETKATPGKGRPSNVYTLSVGVDETIQSYQDKEDTKAKKQLGKIEKLKSIT